MNTRFVKASYLLNHIELREDLDSQPDKQNLPFSDRSGRILNHVRDI